jgi:PAS domain S-box-containing protein
MKIAKSSDRHLIDLVKKSRFETIEQYYSVLDNICKYISNYLDVDRVSLWVYKKEKSSIFCIRLYEKDKDIILSGTELFEKDFKPYFEALREERIIEATDAHSHPATSCFSESYFKPLGINSLLDAPIWSSGEVTGVLCLEYLDEVESWVEEEIYFLKSIAGHLGSIIEKKRTLEYLDDLKKQTVALDEHNLVSITDLNGKIIYCNDKFVEVSKFSKKELLGKDHRIINSGYHPKIFWKEAWDSLKRGVAWKGEVCNRAKDGSIYWVDTTISPIRNPAGEIVEYISIRTDITKRKDEEAALIKSGQQKEALNALLRVEQNLSKTLLEKLTHCLAKVLKVNWLDVLSKGGIFLEKDGVLKLFVSNNLGEIIEDMCSEVKKGRCLCGRAFETAKTVHAHCVDERHENTFEGIAPHGHYNVPIKKGEEVIGVLVLYLEHGHQKDPDEVEFLESCCEVISQIIISHRNEEEIIRARDMAMVAEKAKTEFLANMSHEIRTPMNGVLGMAQLLSETKLSREQVEMIEVIQSSGDSLLTILNDILDLSKIESGKFELEKVNFNLKKCVEEAMYLLSFKASQKGIDLIEKYDDDVSEWFRGDVTRVRQIIVNYISNAIKFTDKGSVTIKVSNISKEAKNQKIDISVIDTGIGVSKDAQERLFKAFSQADNSITRQYGGTGLGLSICAKLTQLMGGEVFFESTEGVGSTFSSQIELEIGINKNEHVTVVADEETEGFATRYPHKILLVEDNAVNRKLAGMLLKKLGYEYETAVNGVDALEKIEGRESYFSLILMDIQMPEMDGITTTKNLLKTYGESFMPIVALTANAYEEDRENCLNAGMKDFITKPVRFDELKRVLKKFS